MHPDSNPSEPHASDFRGDFFELYFLHLGLPVLDGRAEGKAIARRVTHTQYLSLDQTSFKLRIRDWGGVSPLP